LLKTPDFVHFKFSTLNVPVAQNKTFVLAARNRPDH